MRRPVVIQLAAYLEFHTDPQAIPISIPMIMNNPTINDRTAHLLLFDQARKSGLTTRDDFNNNWVPESPRETSSVPTRKSP
jgi:hypothetical protein